MAHWKIRPKLSRLSTASVAARCRAATRTLSGAALGTLMLALVGWGRKGSEIAITTALNRGHRILRDSIISFASGVRDVMASVHSCSFYLGQASGPIAHGFARLHPDKSPGLVVSGAIVVALAYALAQVRSGGRSGATKHSNHAHSK